VFARHARGEWESDDVDVAVWARDGGARERWRARDAGARARGESKRRRDRAGDSGGSRTERDGRRL